eukprot:scaffold162027_cov29-Tisochrysis_lutea.AAC.5
MRKLRSSRSACIISWSAAVCPGAALPRSPEREVPTCQAKRAGYHGSGLSGEEVCASAGTCTVSTCKRTAAVVASSAAPEIRNETGRGVPRDAISASQSSSP